MNFFSGFFKGIGNCFSAFSVIFEKGLWPFLIYPLIIWIFIFILTIAGASSFADLLSAKLNNYFSLDNIPEKGHWLSFAKPFLTGYLSFVFLWIFKLIFWLTGGTLIKYILLIALSPMLSMVSEKAEEKLTGKTYTFNFIKLLKDTGRGIVISLRNMLMEYLFIATAFILVLVFPPTAIVTTPLLIFLSWYYTGFTMLDYNSERHQYKLKDSFRFVRRNKGHACGIGCVYWFFMTLPTFAGDVAGLMFGPVLAAVGATITFLKANPNSRPANE